MRFVLSALIFIFVRLHQGGFQDCDDKIEMLDEQ